MRAVHALAEMFAIMPKAYCFHVSSCVGVYCRSKTRNCLWLKRRTPQGLYHHRSSDAYCKDSPELHVFSVLSGTFSLTSMIASFQQQSIFGGQTDTLVQCVLEQMLR